jgi:hypothetical protein
MRHLTYMVILGKPRGQPYFSVTFREPRLETPRTFFLSLVL